MRGKLKRALMHIRVALYHIDAARTLIGQHEGVQAADTRFSPLRGALQELRRDIGNYFAEAVFWNTPKSRWPK